MEVAAAKALGLGSELAQRHFYHMLTGQITSLGWAKWDGRNKRPLLRKKYKVVWPILPSNTARMSKVGILLHC